MVDCSHFLEEFSDFRDGLLDQERMRSFDAHRRSCSACDRYARVVEQGVRIVRELPHVEPSCDFAARLQHRIYSEDEELRKSRRPSSGTPFGLTLGIAAVIALSAWLPSLRPQPELVMLPPVSAHAPHRVETIHVLFRPAPLLHDAPSVEPAATPAADNLLFYRYSPVGAYVSPVTQLYFPR